MSEKLYNEVNLVQIDGEGQLSCIFTIALPKERFENLWELLELKTKGVLVIETWYGLDTLSMIIDSYYAFINEVNV